MNVHEYRSLLSEQGELRRMLETRSSGNEMGRLSLEQRLAKVEAKLAPYAGLSWQLDRVRLSFGGIPTPGQSGVWADFGGKAVNRFAEAVTLVGGSLSGELAEGEPAPCLDQYRLAVTGTVAGGFELEGPPERLVREGEWSHVATAVAEVKKAMAACVARDDVLAEAIGGWDRRANGAVREFLQTVADAGAFCSVEFRNDAFRFQDNRQVRRSVQRLYDDNIVDDVVMLEGRFEGFLPFCRQTEFRVSGAEADFLQGAVGQLIAGQVERPVAESVDINGVLEEPVRIQVRARRVGTARPRYVVRWVCGMGDVVPAIEQG